MKLRTGDRYRNPNGVLLTIGEYERIPEGHLIAFAFTYPDGETTAPFYWMKADLADFIKRGDYILEGGA